uniref:Ig-like domain-containing protein n=1 Tax=Amphimedon queenslandica TaxID=400682 RepID=A0A1X7T9W5_AMPQE
MSPTQSELKEGGMKMLLLSPFLLFLSFLSLGSSQDGAAVCSYSSFFKRSDCSPSVTGAFSFYTIPNDLPTDVEIIIMTGNAISVLYPGNLTYYKNLTTLHLNDTLISSLPVDLANTTSSIQNLFLDGTPLTEIEDNAFEHLTNLRILSMKRTNLTAIRSDMFTGLTSIDEIYIDESAITSLPDRLFTRIPNIDLISLTYNQLQTISNEVFNDGSHMRGIISPSLQIFLAGNPLSCDCNLFLFRNSFVAGVFPKDDDILRCQWPTNNLTRDLGLGDFQCFAPSVTQSPRNDSILTNRTYHLTCTVTGAPFPEVTWIKDGVELNYTSRVYTSLYNASLTITNVELTDDGVYQCVIDNESGTDSSLEATLTVQESTCFDGVLSNHETDTDCGGMYCTQCMQSKNCRVDGDCSDNLVCLYAHSLPSILHYISPNHQMAYTCELPQVPRDLLNNRIQNILTSNVFNSNFTVDTNIATVEDTMRMILAQQLQIPVAAITNIWFNLSKDTDGIKGRDNLQKQVNNGHIKGTVKLTESGSYFSARINV